MPSIRLDSTSDYIERTTSVPVWNLYTVSFWFYLSGTSNDLLIFTIADSGHSTTNDLYIDSTAHISSWNGGASVAGGVLSNSTWYHAAYTKSASLTTIYLDGAQSAQHNQGSTFTAGVIGFGQSGASFNGRIAAIKVWDATLTLEEINAERFTILPKRYANLNGWYPVWPGSGERIKDYSGLGRDWTESGTPTDEDGPPISWGAPIWAPPFVASGGTVFPATLSGAITPTGTLIKTTTKVLAGSLTPTGTLIRTLTKILAGALTPTGALANTTSKAWAGSITPAGVLANTTSKILAGSITPTGALSNFKTTFAALVGSITPTGALIRDTTKILAGAIEPAGALEAFRTFFVTLAGSIAPAGALVRTTTKILTGALTPTGDLIRSTTKILTGSITPAGALEAFRAFFVTLAGSIAPTGALVRSTTKILAGSLTPIGDLAKSSTRFMTGAITPVGALVKNTTKVLAGSVTPVGALIRSTTKALSGAIGPTGALIKATTKILSGTVGFVGSLTTSGGVVVGLIVTKFRGMYRGMFKRMR